MPGSLSDARGFVTNAFSLAQATPFVPENIVFGHFTFVPWVRTGLAAAQAAPGDDPLRATVRVAVTVKDEGDGAETVDRTLIVRGPGDVIGLDPAQIIRRFPAPGTIDAEESLLAHVEFDRPELPWLFSPVPSTGDRIAPWLVLVVCDATRATEEPGLPGMPRQLRTRLGELQPLGDSWAWAHAQVVGPLAGPPGVAERLSSSYGPVNLSRLLCPRRLDHDKHYIAALVPAFDCGRQSALGGHGGTLEPAWTRAGDDRDADVEIILPTFDTWRFSVAHEGDFEKLAGRLHGVKAPWNVGRRLIDASEPRGNLTDLAAGDPGTTQVLRCALVSTTPIPDGLPPESSAWTTEKRDELRAEVDRANAPDEDLPRVGARLYARFQRAQTAIGPVFGEPPVSAETADDDWFTQLNTSPMHRIVAGLGTRVVQRDQEQLMQAAWAQVGDLRKANSALVRLQFGRYVGEALHRNHLSRLSLGELTQVLRGVHARVAAAGTALTLHGVVARSAVAPTATTPAFRRLSRVRGPLARFTTAADTLALKDIVAQGQQYRDFRRVYVELDGIRTLSPLALEAIPAALVASKLGVGEAVAHSTLVNRLAGRSAVSMANRLAQPVASWNVPAGTVDLATRGAAAIAAQVEEAMPSNFARESARAESLAPLLVGVANASVPAASARASQAVSRIAARLPFSQVPANAGVPVNIGGMRVSAPAVAIGVVPKLRGAPEARARYESSVSRQLTDTLARSRAVAFSSLAASLSQVVSGIGVAALPLTPDRPALNFTRGALLTAVAPATTVTRYASFRLGTVPPWVPPGWFADGRVAPIMAAPHFDRPMFSALDAYDRDWIIPGLGAIPFTDFVTVLSTNPTFTETFLIGLSDEMGRELLWRGYPTDQRGTYFRRFWDPGTDELTAEIHRFASLPTGALGSHIAGGKQGRVVLVVRGEVVRRYPDAMVLALRAGPEADEEGRPRFAADPARILFHHHLAPDILLVGFDLSVPQLRPERWWFLITENPSAPRFGLDLPDVAVRGLQRNNLDWNSLGALAHGRFLTTDAVRTIGDGDDAPVTWPGHGGIVARTLLQNPFRAAFDADKLVAPAGV